ncbi:hypothetical protein [Lacticaseibacillus sp. 53-4]|uniref:hypothetical protein n=1 Tax=Lacticaseibacillus sp. 53-4 TaxID=2799575 RepID=UPI0019417D95|nr:hypothetical protein [Lacticaseibacillus sp. 53-4]
MAKTSDFPSKYSIDNLVGSQSISALNSKLHVMQQEKGKTAILIVSPTEFDGKTNVATSLAIDAARGGRRVLLIAANPYDQSNYFRVDNDYGLSDLVEEEDYQAWIDKSVKSTTEDNLSMITVGTASPTDFDANGLVMPLSETLSVLAKHYDLILVDGPAMFEGNLGIKLSSAVKNVVIVLRQNHSKMQAADKMLADFRQTGVQVLGTVALAE